MGLLSGMGKIKIRGKKGLTKYKEIMELDEPDKIYIPLIIGMSTDFTVHVTENDEIKKGTKIATRNDMYVPIYSPVSGKVIGIEKRMHTTGKIQNHLIIENNHLDEEIVPFKYENVDSYDSKQLIEAMKEIGLLGLGGSGFPTYVKYENAKNIDTILINAVECEPYLTSDYKVMDKYYKDLLEGTRFLVKAANAKNAVIAIKKGNEDLIGKLKEYSKPYDEIEIRGVTDAYPLGWERALIRELFRKDYERFPSEIGIIVNNATTAVYFAEALKYNKPITHRVVTVSGEGVNNPQNVYVPIGTTVDYIVSKIGGYNDKYDEIVVIAGGPMMGKSIPNDTFVISSYSNSITVLPNEKQEELPCLRCGMCIEYCPSKLQPVQIMSSEKAKNIEHIINAKADRCISCGLCSYICPSKIEVTDWVLKAKTRLLNIQKQGGLKK